MFERILVPLDGSKMGESPLPYVGELVSKLSPGLKVEVTLLQVVSSLTYYVVAGEASARVPYTEKELEQAKESHIDLEKIEDFCKIASLNLADFGYAEKKLTLETLKIKVWIDVDNPPRLHGVLPVPNEVCAMSQHS